MRLWGQAGRKMILAKYGRCPHHKCIIFFRRLPAFSTIFFASSTFHSILIDSSICRCVSVPNFYHDRLWIWPILAFQAWHVQSPFFRSVTISGMGSGNIFCLVVIQHISQLPCVQPTSYLPSIFEAKSADNNPYHIIFKCVFSI